MRTKENEIFFMGMVCGIIVILNLCVVAVSARSLTYDDRVNCQRSIEKVYWQHRVWPKENPQPKPSFEQIMDESVLKEKVNDILQKNNALEYYWQKKITSEELQAEMDRLNLNCPRHCSTRP